MGNWLRAPLAAEFEDVEAAYAAYRRLFELTYRDDLVVRLFTPGDLLAFDNRRILHGVTRLRGGTGHRFLRGSLRRARRVAPRDPDPPTPPPAAWNDRGTGRGT